MSNKQTYIGVDLGGTNMRVGLVNEHKIINLVTKKVNKNGSATDLFNDLSLIIDSIIDSNTISIGVGVPGFIDTEQGIIHNINNIPQWKGIHLKQMLEDKFGFPAYINNDANCFALAEKYYGKAKDANSFVGLIIGTGLGAGVVVDNKLYQGINCGAGEFGCISYLDHNYEFYCSGQFFVNHYNISAFDAAQKCMFDNKEALRMYSKFGFHLGKALQTILYAYDPELIVFGGSVSKAFEYFKDSMFDSLYSSFIGNATQNIKIEVSEVENIAIYGAASLYHNSLVAIDGSLLSTE